MKKNEENFYNKTNNFCGKWMYNNCDKSFDFLKIENFLYVGKWKTLKINDKIIECFNGNKIECFLNNFNIYGNLPDENEQNLYNLLDKDEFMRFLDKNNPQDDKTRIYEKKMSNKFFGKIEKGKKINKLKINIKNYMFVFSLIKIQPDKNLNDNEIEKIMNINEIKDLEKLISDLNVLNKLLKQKI